MNGAAGVAGAYGSCEAITREQAANFFYGIRLLPVRRRRAMCAVYAFARRIDDIGDGDLTPAEKLRRLEAEERLLVALQAGGAPPPEAEGDPVMLALADVVRRFALPVAALGELIEGVRMDVEGTTYESFEELVLYCRRVAGAIGRLCLAIFGLREDARGERAAAETLADDLGVAMQLTNILRDLREDAENGRVYLPREDLRRCGLLSPTQTSDSGQDLAAAALGAVARATADDDGTAEAGDRQRLAALVRFEAVRAREWFTRGLALTPLLDRRSAACVLAMAGIYRRLLERIEEHPEEALRRRVSLPAHEKAWVAARSMLGAGV